MLKVGFNKVDITPTEPCYLCGHAIRNEISKGVLDPLYVSAVVLQDESNQIFCWFSFDIAMLDVELSTEVKQSCAKILGTQANHIYCGAIHTHSGPEFSDAGVFNKDPEKGAPKGFRKSIVVKATECAKQALANLSEVEMDTSTVMVEGCYGNRNGIDCLSDKSVNFIRFSQPDGKVVAVLVNMTCHPTVLGPSNLYLSADLFGAVRNALQTQWNCGIVMLQGAAGDMSNRQYRQGEDEAELIRTCDELMPQLLQEKTWKKETTGIIKVTPFNYNIDAVSDKAELEARYEKNKKQLSIETNKDQIKLLTSALAGLKYVLTQDEKVHIELHCTFIEIGNTLIFTVPCELFSCFAIQLKKKFAHKNLLVWGYVDYSVGYLVEEKEYGKTFESIMTTIPKGTPEHFIAQAVNIIGSL